MSPYLVFCVNSPNLCAEFVSPTTRKAVTIDLDKKPTVYIAQNRDLGKL